MFTKCHLIAIESLIEGVPMTITTVEIPEYGQLKAKLTALTLTLTNKYHREAIKNVFNTVLKMLVPISEFSVDDYISKKQTVFCVLDPMLVKCVDYNLLKRVSHSKAILRNGFRYNWLVNYWKNKYNVTVPEFDSEVYLCFDGNFTYSYPSSLIACYFVRQQSKNDANGVI